MKAIKQFFGGAIVCLFEIAVGILLLIDPVGFTNGIFITGGFILIIWGILRIIGYFTAEPETTAMHKGLFYGLCLLLGGGVCVFRSQWFVTLLPLMVLVYSAAILVMGLNKVQWAVDMLRLKKGKWSLAAISAVVSIICSIVIMKNPFASTSVLWSFIGISLIAEALIDTVTFLFSGSRRRNVSMMDEAE